MQRSASRSATHRGAASSPARRDRPRSRRGGFRPTSSPSSRGTDLRCAEPFTQPRNSNPAARVPERPGGYSAPREQGKIAIRSALRSERRGGALGSGRRAAPATRKRSESMAQKPSGAALSECLRARSPARGDAASRHFAAPADRAIRRGSRAGHCEHGCSFAAREGQGSGSAEMPGIGSASRIPGRPAGW